ncbi:MAG: CPBP family intramembrane metalloprotease [Actinobacteria bacterium]|nr:MAG: CPBP family intramembrane metalloprotease [Actinomycetota bacterium]
MDTGLVDRFTTSAEEWTCECGRLNALGLSLCPHCGRVPPRGVAKTTFVMHGRAMRPTWQPRVRAVRLAVGVILLNILLTGFMLALVREGHIEESTAITIGTWLGLLFYGVVLAMMTGPLLTLRPAWLRGDPATARLLGAEVGFGAAMVLIVLGWAASGHPVLDPATNALVSEGSFARIVLAFLAVAVVAPFVEELLFRGVVAESLRRNGAVIAVGVSALLFALAHLQWSVVGITYFGVCGVILGSLYWRRGLWASVLAHAAFNGSLVLLAVVVVLGPTHLLTANGVSVHAASDWHVVDTTGELSGTDLALQGPSGATFIVQRHPVPSGSPFSLDRLAAALNSGQLPLPADSNITAGSAKVTEYPAGRAVQVAVTVKGHAGVVVLVPRGDALWEADIATEGSHRAVHEYPDMLQTLVLPGS